MLIKHSGVGGLTPMQSSLPYLQLRPEVVVLPTVT
jgi:hypothetical protein